MVEGILYFEFENRNFYTQKRKLFTYSYNKYRKAIIKENFIIIKLLLYLVIMNLICPTLSDFTIQIETINIVSQNFYQIINTEFMKRPDKIYLDDSTTEYTYFSVNSNNYLCLKLSSVHKVTLLWKTDTEYDAISQNSIYSINSSELISEQKIKTTTLTNDDKFSGEYLFKGCDIIKTISFENFNMLNIFNISHMFDSCTSLINIEHFSPQDAKDLSYLFYNCISLRNVEFYKNSETNQINIRLKIWNICLVIVIL